MVQRRDSDSLALRGNTYSQQLVYHRLLRFLGKKVGDGAGNHRTDIGQAGEDGFGCMADVFQCTECLCQRFGGAFANVTDAEGKKEARKFRRFAGFYACKDVFRPFCRLFFTGFAKQGITSFTFKVFNLTVWWFFFINWCFVRRFFHFLQGWDIEAVEVGEMTNQILCYQLLDLFLTKSVNVHGFAWGEVD